MPLFCSFDMQGASIPYLHTKYLATRHLHLATIFYQLLSVGPFSKQLAPTTSLLPANRLPFFFRPRWEPVRRLINKSSGATLALKDNFLAETLHLHVYLEQFIQLFWINMLMYSILWLFLYTINYIMSETVFFLLYFSSRNQSFFDKWKNNIIVTTIN